MGKTYEALKRAEAERKAKAARDVNTIVAPRRTTATAPTESTPTETPPASARADTTDDVPAPSERRWFRFGRQGNGDGHSEAENGNGNGHAQAGNGNGNGHAHAGNGNGNGHAQAGNGNGNGHAQAGNGNGNGHAQAGNGNGNGHAQAGNGNGYPRQGNGNGYPRTGNGNGYPRAGNGNGNGNGWRGNGNGNGWRGNGNGNGRAPYRFRESQGNGGFRGNGFFGNGRGNGGNGNGRGNGGNGNGRGNGNGWRGNGYRNGSGYRTFTFDVPPTTIEEFQQLRKNIMATKAPRALQLILLVSSRHGEGATTTTALLGSTMSQGGRCLLIDANFRTPGLTRIFGGDHAPGLCEALADGGATSEHYHATEIPNLYFMPTGQGPTRVPYMFEGRGLDDVVTSVRKEFDSILIDGAPMEMYADSSYLAPRADGTILVVQAESTPTGAPAVSLRELERVGAHVLGAVLNRTQNYIPELLARLTNPQELIEVAVVPGPEEPR
ncbi:MAG: hypothetical protein P8R42_04550 [Candidatus Binatia bacterium]|nr:hypothetical protein [Candidatus Binatia bacterium]